MMGFGVELQTYSRSTKGRWKVSCHQHRRQHLSGLGPTPYTCARTKFELNTEAYSALHTPSSFINAHESGASSMRSASQMGRSAHIHQSRIFNVPAQDSYVGNDWPVCPADPTLCTLQARLSDRVPWYLYCIYCTSHGIRGMASLRIEFGMVPNTCSVFLFFSFAVGIFRPGCVRGY